MSNSTSSSLNRDTHVLKQIKNKVKDNNLIISKADKGNTVAILDKVDYIGKVDTFLQDTNLLKLNSNPTDKFQKDLKNVLKTCNFIITPFDKHKYINMNPSAPVLYGLPKLHKPNIPIRPVVSYLNTPAYKIRKKLNNTLADLINFKPKYTIENSSELIEKINNTKLTDNSKLCFFDVSSLFTSIPIDELRTIIHNYITKNNLPTLVELELKDLLEICFI